MMAGYLVQVAAFLTVMILSVRADAVESSTERVSKIKQITTAYEDSVGRRLNPLDSSSGSEDELVRVTKLYRLMWKDKKLAVRVTFSGDEPAADTTLRSALEFFDLFEVVDCRKYICSGWCHPSIIDKIEELLEVSGIDASPMPEASEEFTGSGSIKTQAFVVLQINRVLKKYPELTGAGVKIGIISTSFDMYNNWQINNPAELKRATADDDIKSGDLPGGSNQVKILNEPVIDELTLAEVRSAVNDEGRAMIQLIHDLVPDAELVFHTGIIPGGNIAPAIEALANEGCDVIVDDIRTNQEPLFQYGYSAQAANKAADEHGIAYFTSARNFGSLSWENRNGYKDTECRSDLKFPTTINYISCHDFNDDDENGPSPVQNIIIETDGDSLQFFWEDTWRSVSGLPGAQTDLDLFLFNESDKELVFSSQESNVGEDAFEILNPSIGNYLLVIAKLSGPSPGHIKWISRGIGSDALGLGNSATVDAQGNAIGTAAVGAASERQIFSQLKLQPYSSRGGIPIYFDENGNRLAEELVLKKPNFVGPDGSYTSFFGTFGFSEYENQQSLYLTPFRFFGTSASAPNVAAVAAIMIQAIPMFEREGRELKKCSKASCKRPKGKNKKSSKQEGEDGLLLPYALYKIMEETAIDMNERGFDFLTGYGFVNALAAVEAIKNGYKESSCVVEDYIDPIEVYFSADVKSPICVIEGIPQCL